MPVRRVLALPLAALLGLALLAGCSDDDDGDDVGSPTTEVAPSTSSDVTTSTSSESSESSDSTESTPADPDDPDGTPEETPEVTWELNAVDHRGRDGERFAYDCPADGTVDRTVWGTDVYTDDSSVCTAAVHAGLITVEDGGRVVIEIAPGEETYTGSEANGVTSLDYGSWDGSFTFPPS